MLRFFRELFLPQRFFVALLATIFLYLLAYPFPVFLALAKLGTLAWIGLVLVDIFMLFRQNQAVHAERLCPEKLSNGDDNKLIIKVLNRYTFTVSLEVIDEIPAQFQIRDFSFSFSLKPFEQKNINYTLKPVRRGVYHFGKVHVFVQSILGLVRRRYSFEFKKEVAVYPSYLQMRRFELLAFSQRLNELGVKKIRKLGHNMEFEQIRQYVIGDDFRSVNWKATARANQLMVNQFRDEKAQQIYSIIDKGRLMQMPFEGMTLLDYAINASLVISNVAIQKSDKAGLMTFNTHLHQYLPANSRPNQMQMILETLYHQKTDFQESDLEKLAIQIRQKITQRSLLLFFTNFETLSGMERQLPYFRAMAKQHLLILIFFQNTELRTLLESKPSNTEEIYLQTIAEKFEYEKKLIVKELQRHSIDSILTTPQNLTINTLNKYLELKARGSI